MTPTYVLVPKYLTHVTQDITVIGTESSIFINQSPKGTFAMVSHRVARREASRLQNFNTIKSGSDFRKTAPDRFRSQ